VERHYCPDSENSWEKESHFNSMKPIQDYLKSAQKEPPITKKGRLRVMETEKDDLSVETPPRRKRGRPRKINFLSPVNLS
jgi:hypothetical protein